MCFFLLLLVCEFFTFPFFMHIKLIAAHTHIQPRVQETGCRPTKTFWSLTGVRLLWVSLTWQQVRAVCLECIPSVHVSVFNRSPQIRRLIFFFMDPGVCPVCICVWLTVQIPPNDLFSRFIGQQVIDISESLELKREQNTFTRKQILPFLCLQKSEVTGRKPQKEVPNRASGQTRDWLSKSEVWLMFEPVCELISLSDLIARRGKTYMYIMYMSSSSSRFLYVSVSDTSFGGFLFSRWRLETWVHGPDSPDARVLH